MMEISVQVSWGGEFAWCSGFGICGGRFRGLLSLVRGEGSHLEATRLLAQRVLGYSGYMFRIRRLDGTEGK